MALVLAGCGGKPDTASWQATLRMTAEKYAHNSVPASFVRSTREAARKAQDRR